MTSLTAHPFADCWPALADDELRDLADDIAANGLREAITTWQGQILDGRNRYAACQIVGVTPAFVEFDGDEDAALAFVQSVNGARRHQSKGSLAASWALSMLAAGKREGGRWAYGESRNSDISRDVRSVVGLIADYDPDLLTDVRDGALTLNAAHESASATRNEVLRKQEELRIEAEAEAKAERFIRDSAPDLAEKVGSTYQTWLEAEAVWKVRNREAAEAKAKAEREERDRKAAIERGIKDALTHICNAIQFLATTDADLFVADTLPHRGRYASESRYLAPDHVDAAIDYLTTIRKAL